MKLLLAFSLIFASLICHAENGQIPDRKILSVHAYVNGASLRYSPVSADGFGCAGSGSSQFVHIDWSADLNYKAMYAAALAAYAAGKTVGFGVNGCTPGYGGDVPKIYRIDVKD